MEKKNELMQRGLSKDKRGDLNQVIVGIVMRRDGKTISHHIFSGNTVDVKAFKAVILDLKRIFHIRTSPILLYLSNITFFS